jgi:hypothetical protein
VHQNKGDFLLLLLPMLIAGMSNNAIDVVFVATIYIDCLILLMLPLMLLLLQQQHKGKYFFSRCH